MTKKSKKLIIGLSVGFVLLIAIGAVAALIRTNTLQHNWELGVAKQQSDADINKVIKAVEGVSNEAILDVYVANANTSGTPFGHSIRINVLVDEDAMKATDKEAANALSKEIINVVKATGVKDTYDLSIGLDVNFMTTSGTGSAEQPVTSAERMSGAYYVYDESFEVK